MQAKERPDEYEKMETRETKDKTKGADAGSDTERSTAFYVSCLCPGWGWGKTAIQNKGRPVHRAVRKTLAEKVPLKRKMKALMMKAVPG